MVELLKNLVKSLVLQKKGIGTALNLKTKSLWMTILKSCNFQEFMVCMSMKPFYMSLKFQSYILIITTPDKNQIEFYSTID